MIRFGIICCLGLLIQSCEGKAPARSPLPNSATDQNSGDDDNNDDDNSSSNSKGKPSKNNSNSGDTDDNSDDSGGDSTRSAELSDAAKGLCDATKGNADLMALAKAQVNLVCSKLEMLRTESNILRSSTVAKLIPDVKEKVAGKDTLTRMRVFSSLRQASTPFAFFQKVRLEVSNPSDFKRLKFTLTPDADYIVHSVKKRDATVAEFDYLNASDINAQVQWLGRSNFFVIKEGVTYAVVTRLTESKATIKGFDGFILINQFSDKEIEVFAITDETYENFGDHEATARKLENKFAIEQTRGYENGLKAKNVTFPAID
jgi:hypothetical protein